MVKFKILIIYAEADQIFARTKTIKENKMCCKYGKILSQKLEQ